MTQAQSRSRRPPRGIRYVAKGDRGGYAEAARRQILGLMRAGVPIFWTPISDGSRLDTRIADQDLAHLCDAPVDHNWVLVHSVPEHFPAWTLDADGRRRAGITVWDTDRLPHAWPPLLNRMERLFVPCQFNRETFARDGVRRPIHLLPHIAPSTPLPQRQDLWGIPPGHFVFYTINAWTERKALWLTIRGFLNAFRSHDPVTLVVKTSREDFTRPWLLGRRFSSTRQAVRRILREYRDPAAVVLIDRVVPESEILALHARGDCFLSLSRCEGWGLGAFDAAAYGTPVIITGYGGQLDYLQPGALGLVRSTLIPVHDPVGYPSYAPDQRWAEPSLQHACSLMRALVADPRRARTSAAAIRERIHEQFNERRVTADLLRALEEQP